MTCEAVQARLREACLERVAPAETDAAHVATCPGCASHAAGLERVTQHLGMLVVPEPGAAVRAAWTAGARRALHARQVARTPTPLRPHLRPLLGAAAAALLALPFVLGHAALVAWLGRTVLGPWVPPAILTWLAMLYFVPVALGIAVLYGAIPLAVLAGRRPPLEES